MTLRLRTTIAALAATTIVGPAVDAQRSSPGRAKVALSGIDAPVDGEFATTICGGPYMLGKGMAYQTKAGDWQITVAAENRSAGKVPLSPSEAFAEGTRPSINDPSALLWLASVDS